MQKLRLVMNMGSLESLQAIIISDVLWPEFGLGFRDLNKNI